MKRWFVPERAEQVASDELPDWLRVLSAADVVAIDSEVGPDCCGRGEVRALEVEPGRIRLEVVAPGRSLVATSLPGPRGWSVWSGSLDLETVTINGGYLGFVLPNGEGTVPVVVSLAYHPPLWRTGVAAASLSLLVLLALGWRARPGGVSFRRPVRPPLLFLLYCLAPSDLTFSRSSETNGNSFPAARRPGSEPSSCARAPRS